MNETIGQFRSSTFGGFNRQDVLDYLESIQKTYTQEKEELEKHAEEQAAALRRSEQKLQDMEEESDAIRQENQALKTENRSLQEQLASTREELNAGKEKLLQAEKNTAALEQELSGLRPIAEQWEVYRSAALSLQISAEKNAQETERKSLERAAGIKAESAQYIRTLQEKCNALQAELQRTIEKAETELEAIRMSFLQTGSDVRGMQETMNAFAAQIQAEAAE